MCILIEQPEGHSFEDEWLLNFYQKNSDGLGIMLVSGNKLQVMKIVPKTASDVVKFYRKHAAGKKAFLHFRMRTHGDVNLEQCHPYPVFDVKSDYPLYLMHNGVLSRGNTKDTTKSDTWHFINDIIRPMLQDNPKNFMQPWFKEIVETLIGSGNKFAMLDRYGNSVVFNHSSGKMWGDVWMSNTYAWDAAKAGVIPTYTGHKGYSSYGGYRGAYDPDYYADYSPLPHVKKVDLEDTKIITYKDTVVSMEAVQYGKDLRQALRDKRMYRANNQIYNKDMEQLFHHVGFTDAYELYDLVLDGYVNEEEVLSLFRKFKKAPADTSVYDVWEKTDPSTILLPTTGDMFAPVINDE